MMSPSEHIPNSTPLFDDVKRLRTLHSAWRVVRSRALSSKNEKTRQEATAVETDADLYLRRLQRSLRDGDFKFKPQRGVAKRKPAGKGRRPLVIAPVANRIVQRAILDVCQSDKRAVQMRLGAIPALLATPTSVGGLPEKGVPDAVRQIRESIGAGAVWYVRSDIKNFFTRIDRKALADFLNANIADTAFVDLFTAALDVDLENSHEIREWLDLFPTNEVGVPQGSSLSALCANIALRSFDKKMNGRGITTIRYLDDFVMFGPSKSAVSAAWKNGKALLATLGFEVHEPDSGTGKAAFGEIKDGFEFLSLRIDRTSCAPSHSAKQEFRSEINAVISAAKSDISKAVGNSRRAEPRFAQTLVLLDRKIRGWGDAFRCTNDRLSFHQLDKQLSESVDNFVSWYANFAKNLDANGRRRALGISLLSDTPSDDASAKVATPTDHGADDPVRTGT